MTVKTTDLSLAHTSPEREITLTKRTRIEGEQSIAQVWEIVGPVFRQLLEIGILTEEDNHLLNLFGESSGKLTPREIENFCQRLLARIIPGLSPCKLETLNAMVELYLKDRNKLIEFEYSERQITFYEIQTIGRMTQLQGLYLAKGSLTDTEIELLASLTQLTALDLHDNEGIAGSCLGYLSRLNRLTYLNLLGCDLCETSFSSFTNLRKLLLSAAENQNLIPKIFSLPNLTGLRIQNDVDDATDLENLGEMTSLTRLNLNNTLFRLNEIESLMHFASLTRLSKLSLLEIASRNDHYFDEQRAFFLTAALTHLTFLKTLRLTLGCLTQPIAHHLAQLTGLTYFELQLVSQKEEAITCLKPLFLLTQLNYLSLVELSLALPEVRSIHALPHFKKLNLQNCTTTSQVKRFLIKIQMQEFEAKDQ